jgi:hypothetical protein
MWMAGEQAAGESDLIDQQHSECQTEHARKQSKAV